MTNDRTARLMIRFSTPTSPLLFASALAVLAASCAEDESGPPAIFIVSPTDGAVLGYDDTVSVRVENFEVVPFEGRSGQEPSRGHFHVLLDGSYQNQITSLEFEISELQEPPTGDYELTVALHNHDHTPVEGAISDSVQVTIIDDRPRARILAPSEGSTVTADTIIRVEALNFQVVDPSAVDTIEPREGHFHVFVDDTYVATPETEIRLGDIVERPEPGGHTLRVQLHASDHSPIEGAVADEIQVDVAGP